MTSRKRSLEYFSVYVSSALFVTQSDEYIYFYQPVPVISDFSVPPQGWKLQQDWNSKPGFMYSSLKDGTSHDDIPKDEAKG